MSCHPCRYSDHNIYHLLKHQTRDWSERGALKQGQWCYQCGLVSILTQIGLTENLGTEQIVSIFADTWHSGWQCWLCWWRYQQLLMYDPDSFQTQIHLCNSKKQLACVGWCCPVKLPLKLQIIPLHCCNTFQDHHWAFHAIGNIFDHFPCFMPATYCALHVLRMLINIPKPSNLIQLCFSIALKSSLYLWSLLVGQTFWVIGE